MTIVLAIVLFLAVGAAAAVHALWGLGSTWPEASAEALARSVVGDGRRSMPPPWQCFAVALVLGLVALWPFFALGREELSWVMSVTYSIAGIFVARGVAGFTPRWRGYFRDEPFATRDRRYYSPFCLLMGFGYIELLAGGMEHI
jgi:hypothetical protein